MLPGLGRWLASIPPPVTGGLTLVLFGLIAAAGVRILTRASLDKRDCLIIAISLGLGLGADLHPEALAPLPPSLQLDFQQRHQHGRSRGARAQPAFAAAGASSPPMNDTAPRDDLLIRNIGHLVTMNAARDVLRDAWLLARGGFIAALGTGDAAARGRRTPVHDARGGIATPGLINTHHHFYQTMARAYTPGNNLPLLPWLAHMNRLWRPFTAADLHLCSTLALAEMMLTGCTTAADHHYVVPAGSGDVFAAQFAGGGGTGRALPRRARQHGCRRPT